jgi:hypothetical protein
MKALCWYGRNDVRIADVPEPRIVNSHDAIVKITLTAICGSDLHILDGYIPAMEPGDILGHEFMGEVVEVGPEARRIAVGDRVVVSFPICCGACAQYRMQNWSLCENTNPNNWMLEKLYGRPWSRRLHRRGRPGSARHDAGRAARSRQAGRAHGERPALRAAAGHPGLPAWRYRLGRRCVRRFRGQVPDGRSLRQGIDVPHGLDARTPLSAAAAWPHRAGRDRPFARDYAPAAAGAGAGSVHDVS